MNSSRDFIRVVDLQQQLNIVNYHLNLAVAQRQSMEIYLSPRRYHDREILSKYIDKLTDIEFLQQAQTRIGNELSRVYCGNRRL